MPSFCLRLRGTGVRVYTQVIWTVQAPNLPIGPVDQWSKEVPAEPLTCMSGIDCVFAVGPRPRPILIVYKVFACARHRLSRGRINDSEVEKRRTIFTVPHEDFPRIPHRRLGKRRPQRRNDRQGVAVSLICGRGAINNPCAYPACGEGRKSQKDTDTAADKKRGSRHNAQLDHCGSDDPLALRDTPINTLELTPHLVRPPT